MPASPKEEVNGVEGAVKDAESAVDVTELVEELKEGEADDPNVSGPSLVINLKDARTRRKRKSICLSGWKVKYNGPKRRDYPFLMGLCVKLEDGAGRGLVHRSTACP